MNKEKLKKQLKEDNEFLRSLLRSFDDIKHGRTREFKIERYL